MINQPNPIYLHSTTVDEIKESILLGYNSIQVGLITPKRKGVMLINSDYQVRGVYPLEAKQAIEQIIQSTL
ncbi:MAG: hypothetical protein EBR82_67035 [Caulobacteraceae bacterium]|jgi:hypothetical protein|nr:hypothetical protein [Caulobacteraceae bacterium]